MKNVFSIGLDNTEKISIMLQDILGEQYHIIIKDDHGNIIFNPSNFDLSKDLKKVEISGDKIANIHNKFYKIETEKINQEGRTFEIIRISDYTNIMEAIKVLQNDDKTGTLRQEQFAREIGRLEGDLKKYNIPFCLVMIDIDNFKLVNDSYGHIYGDKILKQVSKILSLILRKGDVIGRFGGDEFILAISQAEEEDVKELFKKRIFSKLENELKISISAGVKKYDKLLSYEENKNMADIALYFAKKKGKGRIVNYEKWMKREVFKEK